jgi:hypothetical protein
MKANVLDFEERSESEYIAGIADRPEMRRRTPLHTRAQRCVAGRTGFDRSSANTRKSVEHVSCGSAFCGPEAFHQTCGHERGRRGPRRKREMTSLIRSIGIAGGLLVLVGVQNASAQIENGVDFTTPFPFTVGSTTVPAGSYVVKQDDDNPNLLQLTGKGVAVFFETNGAQSRQTPSKTEVVFSRYGDRYVLKDIWVDGSDTGFESVAGEGERHLAKKYASAREERVSARRITTAASNHR